MKNQIPGIFLVVGGLLSIVFSRKIAEMREWTNVEVFRMKPNPDRLDMGRLGNIVVGAFFILLGIAFFIYSS